MTDDHETVKLFAQMDSWVGADPVRRAIRDAFVGVITSADIRDETMGIVPERAEPWLIVNIIITPPELAACNTRALFEAKVAWKVKEAGRKLREMWKGPR